MKPNTDRSQSLRRRGPRLAMVREILGADTADVPPVLEKIKLSLLGPFGVRIGSRALTGLPKKAQALLAFVALHTGRPIPRERLATLLWADSGNEQARRSLRECLVALRSALGLGAANLLATEGGSVCLSLSQNVEIDVRRFESLARSTTIVDLEAAAAYYRDEFLHGLQIGSEPFADWMLIERRRLSALMSDVWYRLAAAHAEAGGVGQAIETAERLIAFDSLREDGHRLLMQLLTQAGRRTAALKQYALCAEVLRRELGVTPEPATTNLAASLRDSGEGERAARDGAAVAAHSVAITQSVLPNKTSIAVVPFANLSGDAAQDYFADGVAEDITMTLGRVPWLFVIASSSAVPYRGEAVDIRRISRELGVRYILRGSVRKDHGRLRIVVQLIDAAEAGHIWAERFDGELQELFAIQDQVASQASAMLAPALQSVEIERSQRKPTASLSAYDLYLRALPKFRSTFEENKQAVELLQRAVDLDPHYGAAYGLAARCYQFQRLFGWLPASDPRLQEGVRLAHLAADIGRNDSEALWMAGIALAQLAGETEHGMALVERSLVLNPNSASAWISGSFVLGEMGDADKALAYFSRAQRLNPLDSMHHIQWLAAGFAHIAANRLREAADAIDRTLSARPTYTPAMRLKISVSGLLGQKRAGAEWARRLLAVNPDASVAWFRTFWKLPLRNSPDLFERLLEGARQAGLPENGPSGAHAATN